MFLIRATLAALDLRGITYHSTWPTYVCNHKDPIKAAAFDGILGGSDY